MKPVNESAKTRAAQAVGKPGHRMSTLGGAVLLAFLFADCSVIVDPPDEPLVALDDHFVGCFCRDPAQRDRHFVCIVPDPQSDTQANGTGRGLLPGMAATDDWVFSGANERGGLEMARILYFPVWGDVAAGVEYTAVLGTDDTTLLLRERFGTWDSGTLGRCGG
jgi:hypothetical protein